MTHEQFDILSKSRYLTTREEVTAFESTLSKVRSGEAVGKAEIADLYLLLEDSACQQEVLWGLLHFIEELAQDAWLPAFITVLPELKDKSPEWADTITSRILNGNTSRQELRHLLNHAPAGWRAFLPILEDLAKEDSPRLQRLQHIAEELITELGT